jgi:hypothetical protein
MTRDVETANRLDDYFVGLIKDALFRFDSQSYVWNNLCANLLKRRSRNNQRGLSNPAGEILRPSKALLADCPERSAPSKTRIALNAPFVGKP